MRCCWCSSRCHGCDEMEWRGTPVAGCWTARLSNALKEANPLGSPGASGCSGGVCSPSACSWLRASDFEAPAAPPSSGALPAAAHAHVQRRNRETAARRAAAHRLRGSDSSEREQRRGGWAARRLQAGVAHATIGRVQQLFHREASDRGGESGSGQRTATRRRLAVGLRRACVRACRRASVLTVSQVAQRAGGGCHDVRGDGACAWYRAVCSGGRAGGCRGGREGARSA